MNQVRKYFPIFVTVLSIVMLFGGTSFAQNTQTVTLAPTPASVEPGEALSIAVNYNCTKKVGNFSVEIYYDDTKFTFVDSVTNYTVGLLGVQHNDADNKVVISYLDIMGSWPAADLPLDDVVTLNFTANAGASGVGEFTIVDKAELPNVTFVGDPLSVAVGTVVTYTVTFNISGNGYLNTVGNSDPVVHTVNEGADSPTVTAIPMTDNEFVNWTDAAGTEVSTNAALAVTGVMADATYTANFQASTDPCAGTAACIDNPPAQIQVGVSSDWSATCSTAATGDGIIAWAWTFRDGSGTLIGQAQGETINFKAINNPYTNATVDLEISTTNGCKNTYTHTFNVAETVCNGSAPFTAEASGLTATFNHANATGNLMFDFGDGTTAPSTPGQATTSHTYAVAGTYTVILTATDPVTNAVCDTQQTTVTVSSGGTCDGYMAGDYDRDGVIDIFDALGVAMYTVNLVTITDNCLLDALDVDGNGSVNIDDALAIARYDVGLVCNCSLDSLR